MAVGEPAGKLRPLVCPVNRTGISVCEHWPGKKVCSCDARGLGGAAQLELSLLTRRRETRRRAMPETTLP